MAAVTAATAALPSARVAYKAKGVKATKCGARNVKAAASRAVRVVTKAAIADPPTKAGATGEVPATTGTGRKKVVVLGSGWGAISFVKSLQARGGFARPVPFSPIHPIACNAM